MPCVWAQLCPLFETPWTVARQAPLSMEFSRHEYWIQYSWIYLTQRSYPHLLHLPHWQADSLLLCHLGSPLCAMCIVTQSCLTLCDPVDYSPSGSFVHLHFPARILQRVAISSSRGSSWPRDGTSVSCSSCSAVRFFTSESLGKPYVQ